jgi:predicted RND superfamily exporter protein
MHLMVIFVVVGISADDMFVFIDAWRQSATIAPNLMGPADLHKRMSYSFKRAFRAMMFTSITTAVAFFSVFSSPIMTLKSFGLFAGIIVLINFYQAVFVFPLTLIINE